MAPMRLYAGTSGFSYDAWRGSFYPKDLPKSGMLAWFAEHLPAVEVNNTFYRMPTARLLETWSESVPESFRFAIKAPRRITHVKRLKEVAEEVTYLFDALRALGGRLGVVLFQLPPSFRKDLERLDRFLELVPGATRVAMEFRHPTWLEADVEGRLAERGVALCVVDADEAEGRAAFLADQGTRAGAESFGYLRLRRMRYGDGDLEDWLAAMRARSWEEAFVFFKHEDEGTGPALAARLLEIAS